MEGEQSDIVARLVAIEDIRRLKARYLRYVDTKQWEGLAALFTDDAVVDIAESDAGSRGKTEFVAAVVERLAGAVTVHQAAGGEIEVLDADRARGVWPMFDRVENPAGPSYTGWGHYTEEYQRVGGRWLISRLRLTRLKRIILDEDGAR